MCDPNSDTIVFNATLSNVSGVNNVINFQEFRSQNMINRMEDYYVRVYEARLPVMSVPFFRMINNMQVTINDKIRPLIPIQLNPLNGSVVYIFYIQQFLDSLNNALALAHLDNGFEGSPPKMLYDYDFDVLNFCIPLSYYGGGVLPVPIFFNANLMYKFTGFMNQYIGTAGKEYRIVYESYAQNYVEVNKLGFVEPTIFMQSQCKYYKDLLEFQSIIITSRSLKINEQYVGSGKNENTNLPILSQIPITFEDLNSSKNLIFSQNYPKWTSINSQGPIRSIDLNLYFVGDDFKIYEMYLLPGQKFNVRLEFIKKNLVKNYN